MGKYRVLGTFLDRIFRNDLNANFDDVDLDIKNQKARVDNLIVNNPQPSELVDARVDDEGVTHTTVKDRLDTQHAEVKNIRTDADGVVHANAKARIDNDVNNIHNKIGDLSQTNYTDVASGLKDHTSQLAQKAESQKVSEVINTVNENANNIRGSFINRLQSGLVTDIDLIGDSITVGIGSTGGGEDPNGRIILTMSDGTVIHEAIKTSPSWGNMFRDFITSNYPTIDFFNKGISGWSVKVEGTEYANEWIGTDNDVCFVMLGHNDRSDCTNESEFEQYIEAFLKKVEANCNTMVVMTGPPTLNDYWPDGTKNENLNLVISQIDRVLTKVCINNGWQHISFYRAFLKYAYETGIKLDNLLQSSGLPDTLPGSHPVDEGYKLMWKTLQQELGLIDNISKWQKDISPKNFATTKYFTGVFTAPITDFPASASTYTIIIDSNPELASAPLGKAGYLFTYRTYNDDYAWQEYLTVDGDKAIRFWSGVWGTWLIDGGVKRKDGSIIGFNTSITNFAQDNFTYTLVSSSHADITSFPEGLQGTLITFRPYNDLWAYQEYNIRQTNKVYKRYWTGTAWSAFVKISVV